MANLLPTIRLLQASADTETESEFRLLVDDRFVKYLTIDAGIYDCDDMCFGPSLLSLLPPLPPGDWNTCHISRNFQTNEPHFSAGSKVELRGVTTTWHDTFVDHLSLREARFLRSNVYEVTCPGFESTIIAKFARFEWEIGYLAAETQTYEWIEGQDIGPRFLGHLTEEGRVIGFLISHVTDGRHASPEDYPLCHFALSRLHNLGIKHGDINKHNFLIHDGKATLIDFDNSSRPAGSDELEAELSQ